MSNNKIKRIKLKKRLWIVLGILVVLTPLGMLAEGTAFGEWGIDEIKSILGWIPQGLDRLGYVFNSLFPDYSVRGLDSGWKAYLGYFLSALIGVAAVLAVTFAFGRLLSRGKGRRDEKTGE